jgi:tetratricopeptide (TPR) repeat protein
LIENTKLLLRIFWQPGAAMSAILDQSSLLYASLAVLVVSFSYRSALPISFYMPLLILAVVYVPGLLLLGKLLAGMGGSLGSVFSRDYSPLLTCTAMAWGAANLAPALLAWMLPATILLPIAAAANLYFLVLMFFAVRTVFGAENRSAAAIVCLSWIPLLAASFLWGPLRFLLGWVASPFFLFYAYYYLGGEIGKLGAGLRSRQNFHRMLNVAAINPHDAEAQYQLGLIYLQRRRLSEAIQRFKNAVAIDPKDADANFQLGRIARQQGRLADALAHFQIVFDKDDKHGQSEILRELGAVYLAARQFEHARKFLSDYVERRPYDPEGLYYLGQSLEGLGRMAEARAAYERSIEAVRTAPRYRKRVIAQWSRFSQRELKKLPAASATA